MHTLVGAGKTDGAMDAANLIKPALARGNCITGAPLDEYRKYVEKDAALARRFQPVMVEEPTIEDPSPFCAGSRKNTNSSRVRISDSALVAAATLSQRYITDRFLPDKAIDLWMKRQPPSHGVDSKPKSWTRTKSCKSRSRQKH